jgi:hypothetical protein
MLHRPYQTATHFNSVPLEAKRILSALDNVCVCLVGCVGGFGRKWEGLIFLEKV